MKKYIHYYETKPCRSEFHEYDKQLFKNLKIYTNEQAG